MQRIWIAAATAVALGLGGGARAQLADENGGGIAPPPVLQITVTRPRIEAGIPGVAATVLTARDIANTPARTLPELMALEAGVQSRDLFGQTGGARATVDLRGFGATAAQNTLVLVNGRRLNDIDNAGVEFVNIPLDSIERVEILRGNSAAVLYGDGAVGGAVNIVTRPGAAFGGGGVRGAAGSYGLHEAGVSAARFRAGTSVAAEASGLWSEGARQNNSLRQRGGTMEVRRFGDAGEWFLLAAVDDQYLGLPGARRVTATSNLLVSDPWRAATPKDFAEQNGVRAVTGITRVLAGGNELAVDIGLRVKAQDSVVISPSGPSFDTTTNTRLATISLTPRLRTASGIVGFDYFYSDYNQIARQGAAVLAKHRYDLKQHSAALYGQNTFAVRPDTDVSLGVRVQHLRFTGGDELDPDADVDFGGEPFDGHRESERFSATEWAAHLGADHRLGGGWTVFGRAGRSFRVPTVDERVLSSDAYDSFALRTQTSWDAEGGVRWRGAAADVRASVWRMNMRNELHFNADSFLNENLDPTRREGVEAGAGFDLSSDLRLELSAAWTRARYSAGDNAGRYLPLVAERTAAASLSWGFAPGFTAAATITGVGSKWMENDDDNDSPQISGYGLVDVKVTGRRGPWTVSAAVNNAFDKTYFNYAVASATTATTYNAYPLAGRTFRIEAARSF